MSIIREKLAELVNQGCVIQGVAARPFVVQHAEIVGTNKLFFFEAFERTEYGAHVVEFGQAILQQDRGLEFRRDGKPVAYVVPVNISGVYDVVKAYEDLLEWRQSLKEHWLDLTDVIAEARRKLCGS